MSSEDIESPPEDSSKDKPSPALRPPMSKSRSFMVPSSPAVIDKKNAKSFVEQVSSPKNEGLEYATSPRFAKSPSSGGYQSSYSKWEASESNSGPSSTVIREPKDWCDESLLIPHEAIRQDLLAMELMLPQIKTEQTWKIENFYTWYEFHYVNVHHHHDSEELIYFPWITSRKAVPPKLGDDHVGLLKKMNAIRDLYSGGDFEAVVRSGDAGVEAFLVKLRGLAATYIEFMRKHLAEEEAIVPALLRENFTVDEEAKIVGKIMQSLGLSGLKYFLPVIIAAMRKWGGEKKVAEFMRNVPPPIRFLNRKFWVPEYLRGQHLLITSLAMDEDPMKNQTSQGCACAVS